MVKPGNRMAIYQSLSITIFLLITVAYYTVLGIPPYILASATILATPCIKCIKKLHCNIRIPYIRSVLFNYCGFILPLVVSVVPLFYRTPDPIYVLVLISLSISLASLHTYITKRTVLINVVRYCLTFITMSIALLYDKNILYSLPLASVLGVAIGSDIIPYIITKTRNRKAADICIIIGGYANLDSIVIAFILSATVLIVLLLTFVV